ncbi:MAG TPA: hypothetical protein VLK83_02510, partial [Rhodanobacteraceae bacterium]|nr:hypothetical protein [Rhodanobacteraceae bacterium]
MARHYLSPPLVLDVRVPAVPGTASPDGDRTEGHRARRKQHASAERLRVPVLILLLVVLWIGLLGWASDAPPSMVAQPAERLRFAGNDFHVVMGAGVENGRSLGINAVGAQHMALQSHSLAQPIDADALPILRYRWQDFPRTLELSFVFRRADQPDDVHTVTLPPAGAYPGYFDLSDVPEWRGRIIEVGFAEFPTAQLVPADIAFRP